MISLWWRQVRTQIKALGYGIFIIQGARWDMWFVKYINLYCRLSHPVISSPQESFWYFSVWFSLTAEYRNCTCKECHWYLALLFFYYSTSAFGTVFHKIVLSWLAEFGISGSALSWFSSYLTDRQLYISLHNSKFLTVLFKQGVPQSSVLGPLLLIIYIQPLGKNNLPQWFLLPLLCGWHPNM